MKNNENKMRINEKVSTNVKRLFFHNILAILNRKTNAALYEILQFTPLPNLFNSFPIVANNFIHIRNAAKGKQHGNADFPRIAQKDLSFGAGKHCTAQSGFRFRNIIDFSVLSQSLAGKEHDVGFDGLNKSLGTCPPEVVVKAVVFTARAVEFGINFVGIGKYFVVIGYNF